MSNNFEQQRLERLQHTNSTLVQSIKRKNTMITAQKRRISELEEQIESLKYKLGIFEGA